MCDFGWLKEVQWNSEILNLIPEHKNNTPNFSRLAHYRNAASDSDFKILGGKQRPRASDGYHVCSLTTVQAAQRLSCINPDPPNLWGSRGYDVGECTSGAVCNYITVWKVPSIPKNRHAVRKESIEWL